MTRSIGVLGVAAALLLAGMLFFQARTNSDASIDSSSSAATSSQIVVETLNPLTTVPGRNARVEMFTQPNIEFSPRDWAQPDEESLRLYADAFPDIPPAVAAELNKRDCSIPQTYGSSRPHNVISGRFTSPLTIDWAVLCSRDRSSSLLVFTNGSADSVIEMAKSADAEWLQGIGNGAIGFSRAIAVASPQDILEHYERYGGPKPPPLDHDGINHAFVEKSSGVFYWHQGHWLELQGAD